MSKFIGVKMVEAVPMTAGDATKKGYRTPIAESAMDLYIAGYEVTYEDGYKSWCPADVFEKNNRPIDSMPFEFAIEALKKGLKVARKGWNGKGMYLWLKPAVRIKSDWCKDPILKEIVDANGGETEGLGTICMKTADNKVLTGWAPNQIDTLSDDWILVE